MKNQCTESDNFNEETFYVSSRNISINESYN